MDMNPFQNILILLMIMRHRTGIPLQVNINNNIFKKTIASY